jgi:DNA adenine methylase
MEANFRGVRPISPVAGYIGGKRNLASRLVPLIQSIPHRLYAEPFVGMGGVFLRRDSIPVAEVVNDASRDVVTFFRILQRHYAFFLEMLRFQLTTRTDFERLMKVDPDTQTDLERAARFLYLQRLSFGGKVGNRTFGAHTTTGGKFNVGRLTPLLEALHERLAGVMIECLPYAAFIKRYDRDYGLFYLDPPYWGCEGYYGKHLFERADFDRLAEVLAGIKGRFIMSLGDHPEVRRIFGAFPMTTIATTYMRATGGSGTQASELVITNHADCLDLLDRGKIG